GRNTKTISVDKPKPGGKQLSLLVTSSPAFTGLDQRLGFLLAGPDGFIKPTGPVTLAFAGNAKDGPATFGAGRAADVHLDAGGAPAYITTVQHFQAPGTYWARASYQGQQADA